MESGARIQRPDTCQARRRRTGEVWSIKAAAGDPGQMHPEPSGKTGKPQAAKAA